jgi:glucan phosphorylase
MKTKLMRAGTYTVHTILENGHSEFYWVRMSETGTRTRESIENIAKNKARELDGQSVKEITKVQYEWK